MRTIRYVIVVVSERLSSGTSLDACVRGKFYMLASAVCLGNAAVERRFPGRRSERTKCAKLQRCLPDERGGLEVRMCSAQNAIHNPTLRLSPANGSLFHLTILCCSRRLAFTLPCLPCVSEYRASHRTSSFSTMVAYRAEYSYTVKKINNNAKAGGTSSC
jgi:hypothetical protein